MTPAPHPCDIQGNDLLDNIEGTDVTDYFPTRFAILRKRYNERLSEIGRAATAAAKTHCEDRMDAVYATVRETLTNASMGGVGRNERPLREHLAGELEELCPSGSARARSCTMSPES
ncbi:hypothetical protein ACD592_07240 [Rhizobium sp. 969_B3_N1_2]|uniref:hypothetical protein n=1 Tax=Rhizobium sp. 969_B3_N1_2 TaxID=3276278 RepID=UPI003F23A323